MKMQFFSDILHMKTIKQQFFLNFFKITQINADFRNGKKIA